MSGRKYDCFGMSWKQHRQHSHTGLSVWLLGCSRMFYVCFFAVVLVKADRCNDDDDDDAGEN